ncbi:MAG: hypothetical protein ACE368_22555 [Paracoccaceae bacterium]
MGASPLAGTASPAPAVPGPAPATSAEAPPVALRSGLPPPLSASVREMAEQAEVSDVTAAMAIYLSRIDEALHYNRSTRNGKS